jgi:hypothetical protein
MTTLDQIAALRKVNMGLWNDLEWFPTEHAAADDRRIWTLRQARDHAHGKELILKISENDHKIADLLKVYTDEFPN